MIRSSKLLLPAFGIVALVAACAPSAIPGSTPMIFEARRADVYGVVVAAMASLADELPPASWMRRPTGWQIARQSPDAGYVVAEFMYGNLQDYDRYVRLTAHVTSVDARSTQVVLAGRPEASDAGEVVVRALVARFGPPR